MPGAGPSVGVDGRASLLAILQQARDRGFLGPGPLIDHLDHTSGFAEQVSDPPRRALDLGSGGGVPGLVLAVEHWPDARWVLLDANQRRAAFLTSAVEALGVGDRVMVRRGRAEEAGRTPDLRGGFDLVVSRSFGPPAVTAECAAPLLGVGGQLVVSEPPERLAGRWDEAGMAALGLEAEGERPTSAHFARFRQLWPCPARFPRRNGVPAKRPLF